MSTIACSKCGSQYAQAQVAHLARFTCGKCGAIVETQPVLKPILPPVLPPSRPSAPPPAARAPATRAPAQPAQRRAAARPAPAAAAPAAASTAAAAKPSRGRRSRRRSEDDVEYEDIASGPNIPLLAGIGGAVVFVGVIAFFLLGRSDPQIEPPADPGTVAGGSSGQASTAPGEDPVQWRALPKDERESRINARMMQLDANSETACMQEVEFYDARDEVDAAKRVMSAHLSRRPSATWVRDRLGQTDLAARIRRAVDESLFAEELGHPTFKAVKKIRDERLKAGNEPWWATAEEAAEVLPAIEALETFEARMRDPYHHGVERWANYQRKIQVMRDYPAVYDSVGPYVIFAQVEAPKGTALADCEPEKVTKAREVLAEHLELFDAFYKGWMETMGKTLEFPVYGPQNATFDTLMKVNIFPTAAAYEEYTGGGSGARAYYSLEEPRFVTTYVDESGEKKENTAQVQFHEGTHQVQHFYTWLLTKDALPPGRAPTWLMVRTRRLWTSEGFAEFFAGFKEEGGKYTFMQPLEERMKQLWVFEEVIQRMGWKPWDMREILDPLHSGDLNVLGSARSHNRFPAEGPISNNMMGNCYYAKVWSLCYYLWYAEEGGKPKYRDRFLKLLRSEYTAEFPNAASHAQIQSKREFHRTFGYDEKSDLGDFFDEWQAWERKFVAQHRKPDWDTDRVRILEICRLDPNSKEGPDPARIPKPDDGK